MQEEIKITGVTVFVNPYTEPDEEEEQNNAKEKNADDEENVCSRIFEISLICYFFLTSISFLLNNPLNFFGLTFRTRLAHGIAILVLLEHLNLEVQGLVVVLAST